MKKSLLTERFQQLAGIKPLYEHFRAQRITGTEDQTNLQAGITSGVLYDLFDAYDEPGDPMGKHNKRWKNDVIGYGYKVPDGNYEIDVENTNVHGKRVYFKVNEKEILMSFSVKYLRHSKRRDNFKT